MREKTEKAQFKTIIVTDLERLKMKQANARQKRWMKDVAEWAKLNLHHLYEPKYRDHPIQIHHVLGRSAKHNKVAIGHWFILPVPFELHDVLGNHPLNVTHHKHAFTDEYGKQRELFERMVAMMGQDDYELPPVEVQLTIESTNA